MRIVMIVGVLLAGSVQAGETQRFLDRMLRSPPPTPVHRMICEGEVPVYSWSIPGDAKIPDDYPGWEYVLTSGNPTPVLTYRGRRATANCENVTNNGHKWKANVCPIGANLLNDDGEPVRVGQEIASYSWFTSGCKAAVTVKTASCETGNPGN